MYKEHPVFNPPPSDAVLWRYMDFTKFVSLLEKQALFFSTPDNLGDPFEGSITERDVEYRDRWIASVPGITGTIIRSDYPRVIKSIRLQTFINCWHISNYESEAMWKLYSNTGSGIAVKTNFNSFKLSFVCKEDVHIGVVKYIDHDKHNIPVEIEKFKERFLFKRKSFEYENEMRAMVLGLPDESPSRLNAYSTGKYFEVDLAKLIKEVIVYPFAPEWFLQLVDAVTRRYKDRATFHIRKSDLDKEPIF